MISELALTLAVTLKSAAGAPIAIESCAFVKSASYTRGVRIVFKNDAKVAAKLVIFKIALGKSSSVLVDEGTFAPGQTLDHTLTSAPLTLWRGETPSNCAVVHVHFVDGTAWGE